jgi:hypothetical protein
MTTDTKKAHLVLWASLTTALAEGTLAPDEAALLALRCAAAEVRELAATTALEGRLASLPPVFADVVRITTEAAANAIAGSADSLPGLVVETRAALSLAKSDDREAVRQMLANVVKGLED